MLRSLRRNNIRLEMGRYDCFLNTDVVSHDRNAELTIILRIFFQQGSGTVSDITGITRQARP